MLDGAVPPQRDFPPGRPRVSPGLVAPVDSAKPGRARTASRTAQQSPPKTQSSHRAIHASCGLMSQCFDRVSDPGPVPPRSIFAKPTASVPGDVWLEGRCDWSASSERCS